MKNFLRVLVGLLPYLMNNHRTGTLKFLLETFYKGSVGSGCILFIDPHLTKNSGFKKTSILSKSEWMYSPKGSTTPRTYN